MQHGLALQADLPLGKESFESDLPQWDPFIKSELEERQSTSRKLMSNLSLLENRENTQISHLDMSITFIDHHSLPMGGFYADASAKVMPYVIFFPLLPIRFGFSSAEDFKLVRARLHMRSSTYRL